MFNRRSRAQRRITAMAAEVDELRARLSVLEQQVRYIEVVDADAQVDAVVGGDAERVREARAASADLRRARREQDEVRDRIADLLARQDALLDQLLGDSAP